MHGNGESSFAIPRDFGHNHRTIKRFIDNSQSGRKKKREKAISKLK